MGERHERNLVAFCRWVAATMDADEATREAILALARSIDQSHNASDRHANLALLDDILMGELGRHHR